MSSTGPDPPSPLLTAARGLLALGAGAVVWPLVRFWGTSPEYADRFLVLAAAGWVAWRVRPELAMIPARPTPLGFGPLLLGAAAFPVGWFLHAQVAPRPVILWWLALAWVSAAAGVVLLTGGWRHLRRLAFPLAFVLFALPIPNRILVPLQSALQSATTTTAAVVLPWLGVPVERRGFVLSLPGGDLGVAEACSGVRSVTALAAIAAFVAYLRGFGPARGLLLLGLAIPVIAVVNAVRVVASGLIQEHVGPEYIRGDWHEALGVGMVLLGLGLVIGLAHIVRRTHQREAPSNPFSAGPGGAAPPRSLCSPILALTALATVAAHLLGTGAEREAVAAAPLEQLPRQLGPWSGIDVPVPDYVAELLTYDAAVHRVYTRDLGYEADVWVIFWSSRNMVKGYHHPDVCWPNRGFRQTAREIVSIHTAGGGVPVTVREFRRGPDQHLVLYWTQEGRRVWTEADEQRAQLAGDSHDWLGERLRNRGPVVPSGRLVVLIGAPTSGDGRVVRDQTLTLAGLLASEIYRLCPWAATKPASLPSR